MKQYLNPFDTSDLDYRYAAFGRDGFEMLVLSAREFKCSGVVFKTYYSYGHSPLSYASTAVDGIQLLTGA